MAPGHALAAGVSSKRSRPISGGHLTEWLYGTLRFRDGGHLGWGPLGQRHEEPQLMHAPSSRTDEDRGGWKFDQ